MEAVMAADRTPYHKYCLKCNECGRKLEIANLNEHEKSLYCSSCYQVGTNIIMLHNILKEYL